MPELHFDTVLPSALVRVVDIRCGARAGHPRKGERAPAHQLLFTRSGSFLKHGPHSIVVADPGRVLFFDAGESYEIGHPAPGGHRCTILAFAESVALEALVRSGGPPACAAGRFGLSHGPVRPALLVQQRVLLNRLRSGSCGVLEGEEAALEILSGALSDASATRETAVGARRPQTRSAHREMVAATRALLARNPEASFSLAAIGRTVACSPFQLSRIFRQETGVSIHQYLLRLRLALALERLAEGEADITRLALELGFSSHSHLTRFFRRTFGLSPAAFRKAASERTLRHQRSRLAISGAALR